MLTDYPDPVLIDNLEINVSNNIPLAHGKRQSVQVKVGEDELRIRCLLCTNHVPRVISGGTR